MNPMEASAQFAAYTWYSEIKNGDPRVAAEAMEFARSSWRQFMPVAHEGLGKLLLKIKQPELAPRKRGRHAVTLAVAG